MAVSCTALFVVKEQNLGILESKSDCCQESGKGHKKVDNKKLKAGYIFEKSEIK